MDLAELVGPRGSVTSVDLSARFLAHLRTTAKERGLNNIGTVEIDLDQDEWPAATFDAIWCRWTHIFLRHPERLVARLANSLRPGGRIALHEYSDYGAWRLVPDVPSFNRFVTAVMASWRNAGGEPDIGAHIPHWLESNGLRIVGTELVSYFLSRDDPMWLWPMSYVETGTARLTELKLISADEALQIRQDCDAATRDARTHMTTPTVIEIIAIR
jgi:SAM-dependent methyltransferase